jgi:peptide/nickel transport system substrate-binding protein
MKLFQLIYLSIAFFYTLVRQNFSLIFLSFVALRELGYGKNEEKGWTIKKAIYTLNNFDSPKNAKSTADFSLANFIYDGLVGVDEQLNIVPQIAEKWRYNFESKTYFFNLRENIQFSDGSKLTKETLQENLSRIFSKKNEYSFLFSTVKIYEILPNNEVALRLNSHDDSILYNLASIAGKFWKSGINGQIATGTGLFYYNSNEKIGPKSKILKLNPFSKHPNFTAKTPKLELHVLSESEAIEKAIEGKIHDTSIYQSNLDENSLYENVTVVSQFASSTWLLALNNLKLTSLQSRTCIAAAFEPKEFLEKAGMQKTHKAALGLLPPSLFLLKSNENTPVFKETKIKNKLLECKKKTLKNLPLQLGIPVELKNSKLICEYFKNKFSEINLQTNCEFANFPILLEKWNKKELASFILSNTLDYPSLTYFLSPFFSESSFRLSFGENKELDKIFNSIRSESDSTRLNSLKLEFETNIRENALVVPLSYPIHKAMVHKCLKGFRLSVAGESFSNYENLSLASDCKTMGHFND